MIYPVVVVEVEGIKCRVLLDTGAGSSYASAALLEHFKHSAQERSPEDRDVARSVNKRSRAGYYHHF